MAGKADELKELDDAFAGLSDEAAGKPAAPAKGAAPAAAPPPVPPRGAKTGESKKVESTRRVAFDDLFAVDSAPPVQSGSGPEAKIEYLREKLKRAEAQIAQFRQAWEVREREMNELEKAADEAGENAVALQTQLDRANQQLRESEAFFKTKKQELDAYGQKVAASFAEQQQTENRLRHELAEAHAETQRQKTAGVALAATVAERDRQLEKLQLELENEREQGFEVRSGKDQEAAERKRLVVEHAAERKRLEAEIEAQRKRLAAEHAAEQERLVAEHAAAQKGLATELAEIRRRLNEREHSAGSVKQELELKGVEMAAQEEELHVAQKQIQAAKQALQARAQKIRELEAELAASHRSVGAAAAGDAPDREAIAEACDAAATGARELEQVNQALRQAGVTSSEQRKLMRAGFNAILSALTKIKGAVGLPE